MNIISDEEKLQAIRKDFPILSSRIYDRPLVYFDNAATSQKPLQVIKKMDDYYFNINSNVHRGIHLLSQQATAAFEEARSKIAAFINSPDRKNIIYTRGTTESINLVANGFSRAILRQGDRVVITAMEHHSNIVPWQLACQYTGAKLEVIAMDKEGALIQEDLEAKLRLPNVKILSLTAVSNTLGTINPIKQIIKLAHSQNIPVLIDAAQAMPHMLIDDVQDLDVDFMAFSGHKMFGPTGIGILYGKEQWLEKLPPYQSGGEMIASVSFKKTTFNELPYKFEAGTPDIAGAIGLGAAIDYINLTGKDWIRNQEKKIFDYAWNALCSIKNLTLIGQAEKRGGVISFLQNGVHPSDTGEILDKYGIAVRTGHHCCQPIMDYFNIPGTVRASFAFYNTKEEVDRLTEALAKAKEMFQ